MTDYTEKIDEMKYGNSGDNGKNTILARGVYKGIEFSVLNIKGMHPCGYVNVKGTKLEGFTYSDDELCFIDVHGGLTFSENCIDENDVGWWLGWDYGHYGDRCVFYSLSYSQYGREYTTEHVISDCKYVIDQIRDNNY